MQADFHHGLLATLFESPLFFLSFTTTMMGVGAVGISRSVRDSQIPVGAFCASAGMAASMPYAACRSKAAGLIWPSVEWRRRWL